MSIKKIILLFPLIILHLLVAGQKEWSNWYSNGQELITFKNGYIEKVTDFIDSIPPYPPYENLYHFSYWGGGGISYSDPATGDVKFIISKRLGFSKDFFDFPNDTFIRSCPDQKSYHIIPFNTDPDKFYVIQFQSAAADLLAQETGLQVRCPNAIGLAYSIVDMSKNGGLGDFTSVNNQITGGLTEQITLVKHANGKNVWIIVHPYGTAQYHAILATDGGFQPPVISNIGAMVNGGYGSSDGDITASHDGKLLAGCRGIGSETGSESDIELFDFDNATGILSNYRTMPSESHVLKLQFSPDNSKLYTLGFDEKYDNSITTQWDFNQADVASTRTIVETIKYGNIWDMQLAPDGKIYLSSYQESDSSGFHTYLIAIQCPNLAQYACNINRKALEVYSPAFPDLVNDFINTPRVTPVSKFSIGNDTAICFGSVTLTVPAGWQTYKWNTGETSRTITIKKAGVYYVLTGNSGFSCPTGYGYINVSDKAVKLNLGKDTGLCARTSYQLHVPDNYTNILWSNGSTVKDSVIYAGGAFSISANDLNGCYTDDTINVYYKYYPGANFGNDTALCNDESLILQLLPYKVFNPGASYLWQDNSVDDNITVTQPGTYWGTVTYDGCKVSDTINVNYVSGQNVSIGNDTTVCMGDSLLLKCSINTAKYFWNTGDTTQSIYVKRSGMYIVKVTNGNCTASDTVQVNFNPKPSFSLGNDTSLCKNNSLTLAPNLGGDYLWQDGSIRPQYTVTKDGLYWLKLSQDGCSGYDSINVTFKDIPSLNLGNDTGFCTETSFTLNVYNADVQSYLWQDQSSSSFYRVNSAGIYSVTVTGVNGCENQDTVIISQVPLPAFTLGNDTSVCNGQTLSFEFNINNAGYAWSDGSTGNQLLIRSPGIYWLTVNKEGCSKTDSIEVKYKPNPIANLGSDTMLCEGVTKILSVANTNAKYKWQDGSGMADFSVHQPGLYFVSVDINGCKVADSIKISYIPKPLLTLGRDTFICKGQAILLHPTVNTAVQYYWQNGSTSPSYNVADTGVYILTVSNECGTSTTSIKISAGVCQLYLPTAFTPNYDNLNDVFRVKYPFEVKQFSLVIFNRFGEKVFATEDIAKGWNGTFKSEHQPAGSYVWVISLTDIDGKDKNVKGTVMLIR